MDVAITKEQVISAYNKAPSAVRDAFNDERTTQIIMGFKSRFGLRIDTMGDLGKGVGYMLLGLMGPQELIKQLIGAGVPEPSARQILMEINQRIFIPLREQIQKGGSAPQAAQAKPAASPPPRPQGAAGAGSLGRAPSPQQPPISPATPHPFEALRAGARPIVPPPSYYAPPPQSPKYPNQENDLPLGVRSVSQIRPPVLPRAPAPPPPNLPGALPDQSAPESTAPPFPPPTPTPSPPRSSGIDPYREPVE